jgi:hypothetical protein
MVTETQETQLTRPEGFKPIPRRANNHNKRHLKILDREFWPAFVD